MSVIAKITNPELFDNKVAEVYTEGLLEEASHCFTGQVDIINKAGVVKPYFGMIERDDFEKEYGFQLTTSHARDYSIRETENPVIE